MAGAPAPLFEDVARGPSGGYAHWLDTADGLRIRAAYWPCEGGRGTILLFPGRTEYIEKYGTTAAELHQRGFGMAAVDWRGQGLADRLLNDVRVGHVLQFTDFQKDVAAVVDWARVQNLPKPWYVIGHSMGGAIALRALMEGLPVAASAFSGPMWGIRMHRAVRPVAWGLYHVSGWTRQNHRLAPSTKYDNYVSVEPFESNMLTTDPGMFGMMQDQLQAHPELGLGGPSLHWLGEAMRETRRLARKPSPDLPCLTFVGSDEAIVEISAISDRMDRWPGGELVVVPRGRHEVLMEKPEMREPILERLADFFSRHR